MGISLPDNRLICLAGDNLAPEKYERIIHPLHAWRYVESEYQFNDQGDDWRYIVNMTPKWNDPSSVYLRTNGRKAAEKLRAMLERGEVVCLTDISILPGDLFYINDEGALICRSTSAFRFDGA